MSLRNAVTGQIGSSVAEGKRCCRQVGGHQAADLLEGEAYGLFLGVEC